MKKYVCNNYVECQAAADKKVQSVEEGVSFKCDTCGSEEGTEVKVATTQKWLVPGIVGAVVVLMIAVGLVVWSGQDEQTLPEVPIVTTPTEDTTAVMTGILTAMDSVNAIQNQIMVAKAEKNTAKLELLGRNMDSITRSFEAKIKKLETEKGGSAQQISKLQNLLANLHTKYDKLEKERDEALKELEEVKQQLTEAKTENRNLGENLQSERKERNRVEAEKAKVEREADLAAAKSAVESYIKEGEAMLALADVSRKAGDNLSGLINGKKKKAAYREALAKYEEAKRHFQSPPPGKGGYSGEASIVSKFKDGIDKAQTGIAAMEDKLN